MKDKTGRSLNSQEVLLKIWNRFLAIDLEFEMMVLKIVGCVPFHHLRRFFYRLGGVKIEKGSTIHTGAVFYDSRNIIIGRDSIIGENVVLDGRDKISIGNHVDIATGVMIYNSQHDINDENFKAVKKPVVIEDYVFIGPRAIILPGVTVGKGAVVAAGAVVAKNVNQFSIVGGVPATEIGSRKIQDPHYTLGRASWFR